ncbi:hypothetical protein DLS58_12050 [Staphylococcus pseudintermedius]|nr:hypothetical protein DLS58_12050 [Staphylococcus pseudintermedius]
MTKNKNMIHYVYPRHERAVIATARFFCYNTYKLPVTNPACTEDLLAFSSKNLIAFNPLINVTGRVLYDITSLNKT